MPAPDHRRRLTAFVVAMAVLIATPLAVVAADAFTDVPNSNVHHDDITWLADAGVTLGCNPPPNDRFCPGDSVTRQQMASFLRRLAENQVVDAATAIHAETADEAATAIHAETADEAATAIHAETADEADTVDGKQANDLSTVLSAATGSFIDGTHASLTTGQTRIARSVEISVPAPGALIVSTTSSWDIGTYVVHSWSELDTTPGCNANYFSGDPLSGSFATDATDSGVLGAEARANLAGQAVVDVPAAGTYTIHHCLQLPLGSLALNVDHALTVQWLPGSSVSLAAAVQSGNPVEAPEGSTSRP